MLVEIFSYEDIHVYYYPGLHGYEFRLPSGITFAVPKENIDDMLVAFNAAKEHSNA